MVELREIKTVDKEKVREWRNNPEISKYMYSDQHITADEHDKWFNRIINDKTSKYWIIVCDNEDVGLVNLYNIDKQNLRCYWAFYISSPNVRGKGVGSFVEYSVLHYVFDELGLKKLCCEVLGFNEPVVRMHKKFGFKEEGLFREHIIKNNKPHNVYCLAILRNEWNEIKSGIVKRLKKVNII
jgi:UDP-4-amino-4,6-dideoxy-N-acetyl-beta-L-altrosamine N-acetyltransferase